MSLQVNVVVLECTLCHVRNILFVTRFSGGANLRLDAFNFHTELQEHVMFCKVMYSVSRWWMCQFCDIKVKVAVLCELFLS